MKQPENRLFIYDCGHHGAIVVVATSLEDAIEIVEKRFPDGKWSYYSADMPDRNDEEDVARWSSYPIEHGTVQTTRGDC